MPNKQTYVTTAEAAQMAKMWQAGTSMAAIARELRRTKETVGRALARVGVRKRWNRNRITVDPTLDEIWGPGGLTEQIRAGWTSTELAQRARYFLPLELGIAELAE